MVVVVVGGGGSGGSGCARLTGGAASLLQAARAELESPAADVGRADAEGDPAPLHRHRPGLEARRRQGRLCKCRLLRMLG